MKHLYFCRHGQSQLNVEGRWGGTTDTPLTAEGRQQARLAARQAKNLPIEHILCSPLSRAHDTARIIAGAINYPITKIEINSLVIERHFGALEGQPWQPDLDLDGFSDIETVDSLLERAHLTLKHLESLDVETILVVSHSSYGRALRHLLNPQIPVYGPASHRLENAKIVKLL